MTSAVSLLGLAGAVVVEGWSMSADVPPFNTPRVTEGQQKGKPNAGEARIRLPTALHQLLQTFKANPESKTIQHDIREAINKLNDVVFWQIAHIERLEKILELNGIKALPECFKCHSLNVEFELRQRQRRHTCKDCGYTWRLGVRDV